MERVLGIGGHFMRAADPAALSAWYRDCLGLDVDEHGMWTQEAGPTVFAAFDSATDYFGSRDQQVMLNFRVRDLDAILAQLRAKGADLPRRRKRWRASAASAGSPIRRATGSSSGSRPEPDAVSAAGRRLTRATSQEVAAIHARSVGRCDRPLAVANDHQLVE